MRLVLVLALKWRIQKILKNAQKLNQTISSTPPPGSKSLLKQPKINLDSFQGAPTIMLHEFRLQFIQWWIWHENNFNAAITFSSYVHAPLSYDSGASFCSSESFRTAGSLGWGWHSEEFQCVFCSCSLSQILFHSRGNAIHDHPPMS